MSLITLCNGVRSRARHSQTKSEFVSEYWHYYWMYRLNDSYTDNEEALKAAGKRTPLYPPDSTPKFECVFDYCLLDQSRQDKNANDEQNWSQTSNTFDDLKSTSSNVSSSTIASDSSSPSRQSRSKSSSSKKQDTSGIPSSSTHPNNSIKQSSQQTPSSSSSDEGWNNPFPTTNSDTPQFYIIDTSLIITPTPPNTPLIPPEDSLHDESLQPRPNNLTIHKSEADSNKSSRNSRSSNSSWSKSSTLSDYVMTVPDFTARPRPNQSISGCSITRYSSPTNLHSCNALFIDSHLNLRTVNLSYNHNR